MYGINNISSPNIKICEVEEEIDIIEWGLNHIGCSALFRSGSDISKFVPIAYALNEQGNKELNAISSEHPELSLYGGVNM